MPKVALRLDVLLDRLAHLVEVAGRRRGAMPCHSDPSVTSVRRWRSATSSGRRVVGDDDGERGVAVPALDLGAVVDRHDVAGLQDAVARDAVHDIVVDRGADRVPVARNQLEVRHSPGVDG